MEGNKSWHCNQCNSKQPTDRKMRIYATSKILIFCFKRFDENRKINPMIEYPLELDLGSLSL
jgi:ubiquitin C-terminal hydrolase